MRKSGILMHITSLPGPYGLGTMGKAAYDFVDFLAAAGQSLWQILPLTPTGYGDSPYQSCSAFAGNEYLIDLPTLQQEGLLEPGEPEGFSWGQDPGRADFGLLYQSRRKVLALAHARFRPEEDYEAFCRENAHWLGDYALYMTLKDKFQGLPWYRWEEPLKHREPEALWQLRQSLGKELDFYKFIQYQFYRQWNALRQYAKEKGIAILGDVPIYVPLDSCEVWCNPELFQLDESLTPTAVAGCPPDAFSDDGQLWGNPLYRWERHKADGYSWWIRRLSAAGRLYDGVRLDHFRGFESYWAVPYGDETAKNGKWEKGPGLDFIKAMEKALPEISFVAEDLGLLTPEVLQLREDSGLPGMKVLQFAFDSREPSEYLPYLHVRNSVCYTGTHDNMTTTQWLREAPEETVAYAREYMCLTEEEGLTWGVIRTAMGSVCDLCVVPMQDYLNLGGEARMNFPGTMSNANWTWRMAPGSCTPALAEKIYNLTALYGRLHETKEKILEAKGVEKHEL